MITISSGVTAVVVGGVGGVGVDVDAAGALRASSSRTIASRRSKSARETSPSPTARSALAFRSSDAEIGVVLAVRQTQAIAVAVAQLAEGMVVVENVYAGAATLIVSSGTRLSSTTIDRLARQLPSRTVQICRTLRFP